MNVFGCFCFIITLTSSLSGATKEDKEDPFIPTKEWQVVKPGNSLKKIQNKSLFTILIKKVKKSPEDST